MYAALDKLMAAELPQMDLYREIGKLVSGRPEKGDAAAASEYLRKSYPQANGFSPRNLRRMRDFFELYGDNTDLLNLAMQAGWTQNIVILESDLTMDERAWYLKAIERFGWSKSELISQINASAHLTLSLDEQDSEKKESKETHLTKLYSPIFHFTHSEISCEICMLSGFRQHLLTFLSTLSPRRSHMSCQQFFRQAHPQFQHMLGDPAAVELLGDLIELCLTDLKTREVIGDILIQLYGQLIPLQRGHALHNQIRGHRQQNVRGRADIFLRDQRLFKTGGVKLI